MPEIEIDPGILEYSTGKRRGIRFNSPSHELDPLGTNFYVSKPGTPNLRPFDKAEQLAELLRERFRKYMRPGSDVAIDECIEGFEGWAKETVNIPSKPTPIGFKQWVLASDGYVFDWLWHARDSNKRDGPQGLDKVWLDERFSATQASVDPYAANGKPRLWAHRLD